MYVNNHIVHIVGGSKRFKRFLQLCDNQLELVEYNDVHEAIIEGEYGTLFLLPDYDAGKTEVNQISLSDIEELAALKNNGLHIYAENYIAYNFYQSSVFGCEVIGKVCHVSNDTLATFGSMTGNICGERVLQAVGSIFHPAISRLFDSTSPKREVLLKLGKFIGTTLPMYEDDKALPVLFRSGSVFTAQISISDFNIINMLPIVRWKRLYSYLFGEVLNIPSSNVTRAFDLTWQPITTRMTLSSPIDIASRHFWHERALSDAVKWHFDSGIILGNSGEIGSVEMIMSSNKNLYNNRRVDAGMYTGWLLTAAGNYFGDEKWKNTGCNIFNYFITRAQIKGGQQDGLFTWYYNEHAGPHNIFSIDSGRCGIALCNMYKLTGEKSYLLRIERLAEGFLRWLNGDLLFSTCFVHDIPTSDKPYSQGTGTNSSKTAAVYAEMASFMVMAWRITGNKIYLDRIAKVADRLVDIYPDYDYYGHTTSSRNARLLMILLSVQLSGIRDYTPFINYLIDYLASIQLTCGGIYAEDNLSFTKFGPDINIIGENGINTPWDNDKISDQLYCINNILASLSLLKLVSPVGGINVKKGTAVYDDLLDYLVRIQICSDDKRLNGGWMRAYNMTLGEYFGLDMDKFWGPYCIMAGWTMGIIPLAFLSDLSGECFYAMQ